MATMRDVAKAAGVSVYTVSATLSGAAPVSAKLRARVNTAIAQLGYERNSQASGLKRGSSSLIGLIVSDITNPFFTELVDVIQTAAASAGYSVLLGISGHDVGREGELLSLMRQHQAVGTILCPAGSERDYDNHRLASGRMKVVAVDNASPGLGVDTVSLDNKLAARSAVAYLLTLGHRRIAMVAGLAHQYVGRCRLEGYHQALHEHGVAAAPELIRHGNFRMEDAILSCRHLLALKPRPTALFVANNLMLIGVMRALAEAQISVPDDISVCGIDDFPWATAFQPALSVVRQPIADMASAAFLRLTDRLAGSQQPPDQDIHLPELVLRKSCAAPIANA